MSGGDSGSGGVTGGAGGGTLDDDVQFMSFKDSGWLQTRQLNRQSVLEYFSTSQFYDRSCDHEVLQMQTRFTGVERVESALIPQPATPLFFSKMIPFAFARLDGIPWILTMRNSGMDSMAFSSSQ